MRAQFSIKCRLSENMAKGGEYADHHWPEVTDDYARGDSRIFMIPSGAVDFEIDLTDLVATGAILALRSNKNIDVRLNDVSEPQLPLEVVSPGRYAYFFVTGDVTKLYISTGADETQVVVGFAGDM